MRKNPTAAWSERKKEKIKGNVIWMSWSFSSLSLSYCNKLIKQCTVEVRVSSYIMQWFWWSRRLLVPGGLQMHRKITQRQQPWIQADHAIVYEANMPLLFLSVFYCPLSSSQLSLLPLIPLYCLNLPHFLFLSCPLQPFPYLSLAHLIISLPFGP